MLCINKGQRRKKREKTGFYLKVKIKQEKREETINVSQEYSNKKEGRRKTAEKKMTV